MYFVVPHDRSIIHSVAQFESLYEADKHAKKLYAESAEHFDVLQMTVVYSTLTTATRLNCDLIEMKALK